MFRREPQDPAKKADARPGFFQRLRNRLNRGHSWLSHDLVSLFRGRKIDGPILEGVETRLLTADVGVEATEHILSGLQKRVARKELADVEALIAALRASIVEILKPCAVPLVVDESVSPF